MEFFDVVNTRKTIRKYSKDHPPIEDIKRIIDAARLAPSANNYQNWRFIAISNTDIKQKMKTAIVNKYDEIASWEEAKEYKARLEGSKNASIFFNEAPVVIAIAEEPKSNYVTKILKEKGVQPDKISLMKPDSSLLSIGAAIENMSLAAHALGYGTCWLCAPIVAAKELGEVLKIKDSEKIVSLLSIGKPLDNNSSSVNKKTLDEVMQIIE